MKTSSAKAKGRRCAQELADALMKAAPQLRPGDIEVTSSGATGEDLKLSPAAREIYPFAIECKNVEALNIWSALEQAQKHADARGEYQWVAPVLAFKRNRTGIYIALKLEDFLCLIQNQNISAKNSKD